MKWSCRVSLRKWGYRGEMGKGDRLEAGRREIESGGVGFVQRWRFFFFPFAGTEKKRRLPTVRESITSQLGKPQWRKFCLLRTLPLIPATTTSSPPSPHWRGVRSTAVYSRCAVSGEKVPVTPHERRPNSVAPTAAGARCTCHFASLHRDLELPVRSAMT